MTYARLEHTGAGDCGALLCRWCLLGLLGGLIAICAEETTDVALRMPGLPVIFYGVIGMICQRLFQGADLAAYRRLAEIERIASMSKTAGFRNGMKYPEFIPVHLSGSVTTASAPDTCTLVAQMLLFPVGLLGGDGGLNAMLGYEFLGFQSGHATGSGGGHRLAVDFILYVAAGKHTQYIGFGRSG